MLTLSIWFNTHHWPSVANKWSGRRHRRHLRGYKCFLCSQYLPICLQVPRLLEWHRMGSIGTLNTTDPGTCPEDSTSYIYAETKATKTHKGNSVEGSQKKRHEQWFSTRGDFVPCPPPAPRNIWQCLEIFLTVTSEGCYWHLVSRVQRCC